MQDHETTARSRELGDELRRVREDAGFNGSQLARKLGWSQSRVSRLESGKRGVSDLDTAVFLAVCGVVGKKMDELLELCREVYASTWLQSHGELIPDQLRTLVMHEATATKITTYEPLVVEGLAQTEDYARTIFRCTGLVSRDVAEARVRARMARQSLINRRVPPEVCFYVGEQALHASAGNARIMNEQLLHMSLVSGRPGCTIRVVPASAGLRGAALGGQFRLMEFNDHRPVVFVERQTSSLLLEDPQDIAVHQVILDRLAKIALNEGQSREMLVRLANDHDVLEDEYEFP